MKCPNCNKELVLQDVVYRNLEHYGTDGTTKLINSICCNTPFIVQKVVRFKAEVYMGNREEDDWGNKIKIKK